MAKTTSARASREDPAATATATEAAATDGTEADWHRRVVDRSLRSAAERSVDRGNALIAAAAVVLERSDGADITVQQVADEAGQSLRTLYQYFASKDDLLLALFEEAMRAYDQMIRQSISRLDEPLERLAGAMIAAASMPTITRSPLDRGMARLRYKLSESNPEMIGRAQEALTSLVRELVLAATEGRRLRANDADETTFMLLALNASYITSEMLGNDAGVARPDLVEVVTFCLLGLGAAVDHAWVDDVARRVELPTSGDWFPGVRPAPRPRRNGGKRRTGTRSA
jgi:AcrR family transcriptional regulator